MVGAPRCWKTKNVLSVHFPRPGEFDVELELVVEDDARELAAVIGARVRRVEGGAGEGGVLSLSLVHRFGLDRPPHADVAGTVAGRCESDLTR